MVNAIDLDDGEVGVLVNLEGVVGVACDRHETHPVSVIRMTVSLVDDLGSGQVLAPLSSLYSNHGERSLLLVFVVPSKAVDQRGIEFADEKSAHWMFALVTARTKSTHGIFAFLLEGTWYQSASVMTVPSLSTS